ncbi:MAG: thioredoxin family protein, partial [Candidatus Binatia bacterium]
QKELAGKGVVWLTVISSAPGKQGHGGPEQINAKRREWNIASAATLVDPEGKVGRLYGAKTTPHLYLIHPEGKFLYMGAIDSISSSDAQDIPAAKNYLRVAFEETQAGKAVTTASTVPYGCSVKY